MGVLTMRAGPQPTCIPMHDRACTHISDHRRTRRNSIEDVAPQLIKCFDRVFKSIFPIEDLNEKATLEYINYRLEKPKFDVEECIARGLTYSSALKCTL